MVVAAGENVEGVSSKVQSPGLVAAEEKGEWGKNSKQRVVERERERSDERERDREVQ